MSPVVSPGRVPAARVLPRRALSLLLSGLLLAGLSPSVAAQDLPACGDDRGFDCVLPGWSGVAEADQPSPFGDLEGIAWVSDASGDAPAGGLDILAAGVGRVRIDDPQAIRSSSGLLKRGKAKQAVPKGEAALVRIVLEPEPGAVEGDHASVHLATDADGSRSNNVPSGVNAPDHPLAGSQDVYSLTWASTTGKTKLLSSDLAKGWYKAKDAFAASWAAPGVLDVLVAPKALGEDFRVVTHVAGKDGGFDSLSLGPNAVPADGSVGLVPTCVEGSISGQPFVVERLTESGQTVRDVEAPASWRGGAAVPIAGDARDALAQLIAADDAGGDADGDADADGRVGIPTWVNLFENGSVIRQRPVLELALDGDRALLALELGLTTRGYDVLRDLEPGSTGSGALDAWLDRATDALRETMPPFRVGKGDGLLIGGAIGACVPWLEPPPPPPDPAGAPAGDETPAAEDAAADDA